MVRQNYRFLGISFFINPWVLSTVLLLIINDHYLKSRFGNFLTGKISDFCGVFFLPLFICACWLLLKRMIHKPVDLTPILLVASIVLTDVFFVALNLSEIFNGWYLEVMARVGIPSQSTLDPSDLIALAMNPFTFWFGQRYFSQEPINR